MEILSDWSKVGRVSLVLLTLLAMSAWFVYPGQFKRRLTILRFCVLALFFIAAVSATLVITRPPSHSTALYILRDRSASMDVPASEDRRGAPSRSDIADQMVARLKAEADSRDMKVREIHFADRASDAAHQVGDRKMTKFAPALSLLLEKAAEHPSEPVSAVLVSDGAAADEPTLDPYLSALMARGIPISVHPVGAPASDGSTDTLPASTPPRLFFKIPPPSTATAGESVPLGVGLVSPTSCVLTVLDGASVITERRLTARTDIFTPDLQVPASIRLNSTGLRTVRIKAENPAGSAHLRFRIKVLPKLVFEMRGRPVWDARFFLVAAAARPQISVKGLFGGTAPGRRAVPEKSTEPPAPRVLVNFDPANSETPNDVPVIFWPQMESAVPQKVRGARWLGRETGSFMPAFVASDAQRAAKLPPVGARQKLSLDLGWNVLERYTDGAVFLAEWTDPANPSASPAFLINGEGLWRWWINPTIASGDAAPAAYTNVLERIISWAWKSTTPPVELFALQEEGQIGAPMDFVALFSAPPSPVPPLTVMSPDKKEMKVYGAGSTIVRYSFAPSAEGRYSAAVEAAPRGRVVEMFQVSDMPFDVAHPEARPETLRRIAARTGGRVLPGLDPADHPPSTASPVLGALDLQSTLPATIEETRIVLSRSPFFLIALMLLFAVLWTLESRWLR